MLLNLYKTILFVATQIWLMTQEVCHVVLMLYELVWFALFYIGYVSHQSRGHDGVIFLSDGACHLLRHCLDTQNDLK